MASFSIDFSFSAKAESRVPIFASRAFLNSAQSSCEPEAAFNGFNLSPTLAGGLCDDYRPQNRFIRNQFFYYYPLSHFETSNFNPNFLNTIFCFNKIMQKTDSNLKFVLFLIKPKLEEQQYQFLMLWRPLCKKIGLSRQKPS